MSQTLCCIFAKPLQDGYDMVIRDNGLLGFSKLRRGDSEGSVFSQKFAIVDECVVLSA